MVKVKFSCNVEAWIKGIEIEGSSREDCQEKLYGMTLEELIENGYVKQSEITEVDSEILEEDYKVEVNSVEYDYDMEDDEEVEKVSKLPKEFYFTVHLEKNQTLSDAISDVIFELTGFTTTNFNYEIRD